MDFSFSDKFSKLRKRQHISKSIITKKYLRSEMGFTFSVWCHMTDIFKIRYLCKDGSGAREPWSWHSPDTIFVISIYNISSLHPLIPSGPTLLRWSLFSGWCVYLCCIYSMSWNSHIPVVFAAKEQDYTTNNPVETSIPTWRNASHSMKLKLTRHCIRLQIAS